MSKDEAERQRKMDALFSATVYMALANELRFVKDPNYLKAMKNRTIAKRMVSDGIEDDTTSSEMRKLGNNKKSKLRKGLELMETYRDGL